MNEQDKGAPGAEEIRELMLREEFIAAALQDAYQRGKIHNLHFSPAWDVTVCRMSALSFALEQCEASGQQP